MQTTIQAKALQELLPRLAHCASRKTTLPVLTHVLIQAENDTLSLTTTNLEVMLTLSLPAQTDTPWSLSVPFGPFQDAINRFSGNVTLDPESLKLTIRQPERESRIKECYDAGEYPSVPWRTEATIITRMDSTPLVKEIKRVAVFALKGSDVWQNFASILLEIKESEMSLVGADRYRLGKATLPVQTEQGQGSVMMPISCLPILPKVLPKQAVALKLEVGTSLAAFTWEGGRFTTRLLAEGAYPNFQAILSDTARYHVQVQAGILVERVTPFAKMHANGNRKGSFILSLDWQTETPEHAVLHVSTDEVEHRERLPYVLVDGELSHGFLVNPAQLLEAAQSYAPETMLLLSQGASNKVIFLADASGQDSLQTVIMPMHELDKKPASVNVQATDVA